jgi:heme oxygenase
MITQAEPIMHRLRRETREHHKTAESTHLQRSLATGSLPRRFYVEMLGQRHLIHQALEAELRDLAGCRAAAAQVIDEKLFQEANLRTDLRFLGEEPDRIVPTEATKRLLDRIARASADHSLSLLGFYYVLEGGKNGTRLIAERVSKAYGLSPGPGLLYLDPHGADQTAFWSEFKDRMNQADFRQDDCDEIVAAAKQTFEHLVEIDRNLYSLG